MRRTTERSRDYETLERRLSKIECIVEELGKDAKIKELNERLGDQAKIINNLQQQLMLETQARCRAEVEMHRAKKDV